MKDDERLFLANTDKLILSNSAEVIGLSRERVLARCDEGSFFIEAPSADVLEVLSALDGSAVEDLLARVPPTHEEFSRTLLTELLGTVVCKLDADTPSQTSPTPTVTLIGNGRFVQTLHRRFTESLGDCRLARIKECGDVVADRIPRRQLRKVEFDHAQIEPLFADSDVVICALENVAWSAYTSLNKMALASPRAVTLFVSADADLVTVGPAVRAARGPCFACERLARLGLGRQPEADEDITRAFAALAVDSIAERPPVVRECIASAIAMEAIQALKVQTPTAQTSVTDIGLDGTRTTRAIARSLLCPECATSSASHHPAFRWPESAAQVDRLPARGLPFEDRVEGDRRQAIAEIEKRGASALGHAVANFREHLDGTWRILTGWGLPDAVCLAGQYHSVYGSDVFERPLFSGAECDLVAKLIGKDAERLARLFCTLDRGQFARQLNSFESLPDGVEVQNWRTKQTMLLRREDVAAIAAIEVANIAEQAHAGDLTPGVWVARCARWAQLLRESGFVTLAPLASGSLTEDAERRALALYIDGVAGMANPVQAKNDLRRAGELNPFVGEPLLAAAHAAQLCDDGEEAAELAASGRERMWRWHCSWDKRASLIEWLALAERLTQNATSW